MPRNQQLPQGAHTPRALRLPVAVVVVAVIALAFLVLPLAALVAKTPWTTFGQLLVGPVVVPALTLSLGTAAVSTLLCLVLGIPLALLLASAENWPTVPRRLLRAFITVPLVLPPVVGGIALLLLLGRRGLLGGLLDSLGISLPFTTPAVVIAQTFVSLPFMVFAVEGALRSSNRQLEEVAADLYAPPLAVLRYVTLPLVLPGMLAGVVMAFTRALGEFGATITFAGSLPGVTRTLPIASYLALETDQDDAIALAFILIVISLAVILSLRDRWLPSVAALR